MRKLERWAGILGLAASMLYSQYGMAVDYTTMNVEAGQTLDIAPSDKVYTATGLNNKEGKQSIVKGTGTLNNQGAITTRGGIMTRGTLNNQGFILDEGHFSIGVGGGTVVNHADGKIYVFGPWMHLYDNKARFENAGTFVFGPSKDSYTGDGIWSRGTIKNTGTMILDRNRGSSVCSASDTVNYVVNEGRFYIENGTICNFFRSVAANTIYTQNDGEIKVNGTFGAHQITINKGLLSGTGTIKGNFRYNPLYEGVTIAPGGRQGTLSIVPEEGFLMCYGCSIEIELESDTQFDQLHVEGEYYMDSGIINVVLRDGYVPAPGSHFSIITAALVADLSPSITNLPMLPNGRTWSVQYTGTEIILIAN